MKKKIVLCLTLVILIEIVVALVIVTNKNRTIPDNYIAVFHGGVGEMTHETYVYKIKNGKINSGFEYINTESTTVSYGSPEWKNNIIKRGKVDTSSDVFEVASKNGAYSYVTLKEDNNLYSIDEFKKIFLIEN